MIDAPCLLLTKEGKTMISIAVVDDNEQDLVLMAKYIEEECSKMNVQCKVNMCSNGEDLFYVLNDIREFDIVFLDIELERDNGIETAMKLREKTPYAQIIFVSGYQQYYKDAFRVQPFQFIDKPIDEEEFRNVIRDVLTQVVNNDEVYAFEFKWQQYRILLRDILYFSSSHRIIKVHTRGGEVYEFYGKMGNVEKELEKNSIVFLRVHKSYLVNMAHIKMFSSEELVLQNGKEFKISSRKRKSVIEKYMIYAS